MAEPPRSDDIRWMTLALSLGRRGQGQCWPNPAVGCVIVQAGRVVGRGWTRPGGRPHAEVIALAQAGAAARGATAYVTLEPCSHHGKTSPCVTALIDAGIARVVTALEDPDPRVSGAGHEAIRKAGLDLLTGVCAATARRDHLGFLSRVTLGRPMLTLKLATTLDGRIATAAGESQWITGPAARRMGHALRARHDAVLVGAGTARADDPTLTVRDLGVSRQPVRLVASRDLNLPIPSNLTASVDQAPLWIAHGQDAPQARTAALEHAGAHLIPIKAYAHGLDLAGMFHALGDAGLTRVYCEGGGVLAAALLTAGLVDDLVLFTAGAAIGADGRAGLGPLSLPTLSQAPRFMLLAQRAVGGDLMSHWARHN